MTTLKPPPKQKPQPTLIDARMKLFLKRRLLDILAHLSDQKNSAETQRTRRALNKLKKDQFGICESCDYPIDIGRILIDPAVELCECCEHGINCPIDHPLNQASFVASPPIAPHN